MVATNWPALMSVSARGEKKNQKTVTISKFQVLNDYQYFLQKKQLIFYFGFSMLIVHFLYPGHSLYNSSSPI